ncbi:hypothetical protein [Deinococcus aerophilus]|uniref:DUF4198 domain-containing protein n=1 Tax=Deinococcus aerophilus TaxID=522488 RepID=A0ABQ2GZH3_9DEIO|nr:hypothetical protein [Deinococcus aerophilus]GGM19963.1 hypothetical protein GCM10010841_30000 [Deinococcus aerophilus]
MHALQFSLAALTLTLLSAAAAQSAPNVTITTTKDGYQVPAQVPAGYVHFTLKNDTDRPAEIQLFKLNPGVSADTLKSAVAALATDPGDNSADVEARIINSSELYGGVPELAAKANYDFTVNLEPGTYVVSTTSSNGDEKNPQALANLGYFQTFEVTKGDNAAAAPKADYRLQLADFALAFPATNIAAGQHTWEVVNDGRQPHFVMIMPVKPGKTEADVMKFMMSDGPSGTQDESPISMDETHGGGVISPGKTTYIDMNLAPGNYFAVCFVTDPKTKMPHAMLGMTRFFSVK